MVVDEVVVVDALVVVDEVVAAHVLGWVLTEHGEVHGAEAGGNSQAATGVARGDDRSHGRVGEIFLEVA